MSGRCKEYAVFASKNGCLGRCPSLGCGLLMHYSCVLPSEPGGDQQCPICKTEIRLQNESETKLPLWHEAE
eukprot:9889465-Karenia_brevis.AAC.1